MKMQNTMQDILEMHGKISNDPWANHRRIKDQQDLEMRECVNEQRTLENLSWFSKSNANAQMDRFQWMQRRECEMLRNMQMKETEFQILKNNESLENQMGKYLEKEKNESLHKDRYSQYLRENDPGLRILASQLREAYVNKIRLAQIDEKERLKSEIANSDLPFVRAVERQNKIDEDQEKLNLFLEEEKKYNFRKQLEQQMKDKEYFDAINDPREEDRQRIEAIIKDNLEKIKEEKEKEFEGKMALRKSYMDAFKAREEELLKEKQRLLAEEEKLRLFTKHTDNRNEGKLQEKRLREENLNEIQRRLGELLAQKQRDIDEFEAARQDVAIAQAEMQAFKNDKIERDTKEKAKMEYVAELNKFKEFARETELANKNEERQLERNIEALTKLKDEEQRLRELQKEAEKERFKLECRENMKEKLLEKERCHENEKMMDRMFIQNNEKYDSDVDQERTAMIKEMAPHLYPGCIPRGMLKEKDIEHLEDPLKNFLINKKSYPDVDGY